jgi:hypothetical protein
MPIVELDDDNWESKLIEESGVPLLLAFHRAEEGVFGKLNDLLRREAPQSATRVAIVNVDQFPKACEALGVLSVPNWIILKDDVDVRRGYIGPWVQRGVSASPDDGSNVTWRPDPEDTLKENELKGFLQWPS